jgi:hypothetical protein
MKQLTKIMNIAAILLVLAGCFSCGKEDENCSCGESSVPIALKGTMWMFAGIMDVETCKLRELEPQNCDHCYTLTFDTDSTAKGKSVMNEIRLQLLPKIVMGTSTKIDDSENGDVQLFYDAMETIASCTITENELKFCYNDGKNYLLFRKKIFVPLY